ncbi:hypothetical protein ACFLQ7_04065, partial [Actinomycetota bacterium]
MRSTASVVGSWRSVAFVLAIITAVVVLLTAQPAWAIITAPGGRSVAPGNAVSVTATTDQAGVCVQGSAPNVSVAPGCGGPSQSFTFTAFASATPGSYSFTFTDGASSKGFTLTVTTPPTTTTT